MKQDLSKITYNQLLRKCGMVSQVLNLALRNGDIETDHAEILGVASMGACFILCKLRLRLMTNKYKQQGPRSKVFRCPVSGFQFALSNAAE